MKKITISVFFAIGALLLIGCNNHFRANEQRLQPMQQSYQGILPCADCGGIETSLFLNEDGTFVLQEKYLQGKEGDSTFAEYGNWARTADKLVLTDNHGEKRYFRPQDKNLEMLDRSGLPIKSTFNYQLKPVKQDLPTTPMALTGMYKYFADAARFTDCTTGKSFPVDNTVALQQGYSAAGKAGGEPVFVTLNGHFMLLPSAEEGLVQKTLVVDGPAKFDANQRCR